MANLEGESPLPDVSNNFLQSFVYHGYDLLGKEFSRFFDMKSALLNRSFGDKPRGEPRGLVE